MTPYLFVFKVKPKSDNPQAQDVAGAHATIIAFSNSQEAAKKTSINYFNEYGWTSEELEHAFEPTASQVSQFDVVLQSVYRKAELNGVSAQFDGCPKNDRPGVYSVESLKIPQNKR